MLEDVMSRGLVDEKIGAGGISENFVTKILTATERLIILKYLFTIKLMQLKFENFVLRAK